MKFLLEVKLNSIIDLYDYTLFLFEQVYKEFEKRVLEGTEIFYNQESLASIEKFFTEQHSFVKYMDHVKKCIDEEMKDRVKLLHITTEEPLMTVLSDTLIKRHLELFDSEFRVCFYQRYSRGYSF